MYQAILLKDKDSEAQITSINFNDLPSGDVTIQIEYSTINYKDSLAIINKKPIIRKFPMVPGIDFVGKVLESEHPNYKKNQKVILTGWGVGESHWGGLSQIAKVKGDWLVPLPVGMSPKMSMEIGTAGFTAMLAVKKIQNHGISPSDGKILVSGATGGVGSLAILILSTLGYEVIASTGKENEYDYLKNLGASEVINRSEFDEAYKPLEKQKWIAAIDTVGGKTLANIFSTTKSDGAVAACGMVQGIDFSTTVAPFILRGITLYGINSVTISYEQRVEAWENIYHNLIKSKLETVSNEYKLKDAINIAKNMLSGKVRGRCIIDVSC